MAKILMGVIRKVTPAPVKSMYRAVVNVVSELTRSQADEDERLEGMVGPPGVWQESRDFQIEFLTRRGLQPDDSLLDIGCGPLRGGIPLIRYLREEKYTGIDVRQIVIEEAWRQIKKDNLTMKAPHVFVSESFGHKELGETRFDYVWCFQVFYHLNDQLLEDCVAQIASRLAEGGRCYANVNLLLNEGSWKEFPYVRRSLSFYGSIAEKYGLQTHDLGQQREWGYTDKVPGQYDYLLEFRHSKK